MSTKERTIIPLNAITESGEVAPEFAEWSNIDASETPDEMTGGSASIDQDVVDEIGKAIGVTYHEDEPLRAGRKEEERDEHRWELDPASAEDYVERSREAAAEAEPVLEMKHRHREKAR